MKVFLLSIISCCHGLQHPRRNFFVRRKLELLLLLKNFEFSKFIYLEFSGYFSHNTASFDRKMPDNNVQRACEAVPSRQTYIRSTLITIVQCKHPQRGVDDPPPLPKTRKFAINVQITAGESVSPPRSSTSAAPGCNRWLGHHIDL